MNVCAAHTYVFLLFYFDHIWQHQQNVAQTHTHTTEQETPAAATTTKTAKHALSLTHSRTHLH